MDDIKFYRNNKTGEIRVVKIISKHNFVVVKFHSKFQTVKVWTGSLKSTARHWNTLPWTPTSDVAAHLIISMHAAVRKAFGILHEGFTDPYCTKD